MSMLLRLLALCAWVPRLLWHGLYWVLVPPRCAACDRRLGGAAVFCAACLETVVVSRAPGRIPGAAIVVHAFGIYGGALGEALRRFKYRAHPELARPLGELLRRVARAGRGRWDVVVPVPLHPRRLATRGYNQSALLARIVAAELGVPFTASSLRRTVDTPAQARLDASARRRNLRDAFAADARIAGKRVLLVDDIATTGATLASCVEALRHAGAKDCEALVVAQATN
jgi:ComF family protein